MFKFLDTGPSAHDTLRSLELCSGTSAMTLLLQDEFSRAQNHFPPLLDSCCVDVSTKALRLGRFNRDLQIRKLSADASSTWASTDPRTVGRNRLLSLERMQFLQANILSPGFVDMLCQGLGSSWDILMANPPYISPRAFDTLTARSVRNHEPRIALVPPPPGDTRTVPAAQQGDTFYPSLLTIAVAIKAKVVALEVGSTAQAVAVYSIAQAQKVWDGIEIWHDNILGKGEEAGSCRPGVQIRGSGNARAVICYRGAGIFWPKGLKTNN